jgi:hypothetical protein
VKAEVAGREPPLDRSTQRCAPAPAVRVAAAFPVTWIVDSLNDAPRHDYDRSEASTWSLVRVLGRPPAKDILTGE